MSRFNFLGVLVVLAMAGWVSVYFVMWPIMRDGEKCEAAGGVMADTAHGYRCVQAIKVKP